MAKKASLRSQMILPTAESHRSFERPATPDYTDAHKQHTKLIVVKLVRLKSLRDDAIVCTVRTACTLSMTRRAAVKRPYEIR